MKDITSYRYSFFLDLMLAPGPLPDIPLEIVNTHLQEIVFEDFRKYSQQDQAQIFRIYDLPEYLQLKIPWIPASHTIKSAPLYDGFLIDLEKFNDYQNYLIRQFDARRRSRFRGMLKRLDHCLSPKYKMYYGTGLSKKEYTMLFEVLREMIVKRFEQKQESNYELAYLDHYQMVTFEMILQKKACLFVIYDCSRPVNISINYIMGKTIYLFNSTYDINYGVFNLGHINMLKHLEWCFENRFKLIDLGRGDFLHKRQWITQKYVYKECFIFPIASTKLRILANYNALRIKVRYKLIKFLKVFGAHRLYSIYSKLQFKVSNRTSCPSNLRSVLEADLTQTRIDEEISEIRPETCCPPELLPELLEFLVRYKVKKASVKVYESKLQPGTYYFTDGCNSILLSIVPNDDKG